MIAKLSSPLQAGAAASATPPPGGGGPASSANGSPAPADTFQAAPAPPLTVSLGHAARTLFASKSTPEDLVHAASRALLQQDRDSEVSGASRRSVYEPRTHTLYAGKIGPSPADARFEKKYLVALDDGGHEKWTSAGPSMTSDPVLDAHGRVCYRSRDRLHVIDADGHEIASVPTSDAASWKEPFNTRDPESLGHENPFNMAPLAAPDGTVFLVTSDDALGFENCRVMAVRDGHEAWSHPIEWHGRRGADLSLAGNDLVVKERVLLEDPSSSWLGRIFDRKDPRYGDRVTCLAPSGQVRYQAMVGDPVSPSWSEDNEPGPMAAAGDGSTRSLVRNGSLVTLDAHGQPSWTFKLEPPASDPNGRAAILCDPVTDADGNTYLVGYQSGSSYNARSEVRVVKLDPAGHVVYDEPMASGFPKRPTPAYTHPPLEPLVLPDGGLALVTEEKSGGIAVEEREHLIVLDSHGHVVRDFLSSVDGAGGWNTDVGMIRSVSPGADGELLVEMAPYYCTSPGQRSILAVPYKATPEPPEAAVDAPAAPTAETGIVMEDEQVVIGGVRVPKRGQAASPRSTPRHDTVPGVPRNSHG